ncbi:MAG TPA: metallophosphoesterase family protein [Gammaproteobacteria bacterium]|jgi:putative phosphoesterase
MLIGIISDTHGLLRPQAVDVLQGSELVIHAGDIGSADVVERLSNIAPVVAIRGNVDTGEWAEKFPAEEVIKVHGRHLYVLHNLNEIDLDPAAAGFDVVISGHSHKPLINKKDGVLYVNPGSAGPRRFKLPVAVAMLRVTSEDIQARIRELIV